ncbi:MAG: ATP-binding protein [Alphaproteobacteria bacterium]
MDNIFIRNFVFFAFILGVCAAVLSFSLISQDRELGKSDELVLHTHTAISEVEEMSTRITGMLGAQRGYIITGDEKFLHEYESLKFSVSESMAKIAELISDNPSQMSRMDEIRNHFAIFSNKLEERAETINSGQGSVTFENVQVIDNLKDNIVRLNNAVLDEEYELLSQHFAEINQTKNNYLTRLLYVVIIGAVILITLNGFLMYSQRYRRRMEASLKETEERMSLALDGTSDGIFDWNLLSDTVFYSSRFFEMLGYERKAFNGTPKDFTEILHPDDHDKVLAYINSYLNKEIDEYKQEFRMKHKSGRWVWIQSKAKALYDPSGKAYRLVGAHSDITYLIKEQEKLEADKEEAEHANRAKSEFLAHMSHEIRTPLTAISGIAEILEKNKAGLNDKQQSLVHTLLSSTASLKDLINDILDFSKIESGQIELEERVFPLDDIFENVISMMALKACEKGISFVFDYNQLKNVEFCGDSARIRQILINLVNNAIKFTEQGGAVSVRAEFEERGGHDFMRIDVIDTGIGIEPEAFDLVFERFKQGDSSVSRKYGGSGLGLPISKNLAKLMGGDIFLNSQVGKGTTFTLLLPMKFASRKMQASNSNYQNEKLNERLRDELSGNNKVLLVEDYHGNIVFLSYILDDINIKYDIAGSGVEALKLFSKNHYDLILMDIQMPEMDGLTATRKIRALEKKKKLASTPIVGMTAHAMVGDRDKCLDAGMNSYIPKPIVEADLKREFLRFLNRDKKAA